MDSITTAHMYRRLCPLDIVAAAGINQQMIPFIDKQRHFNNITGVHGGRFAAAGSGIAPNAGFGLHNYQFYRVRQFYAPEYGSE